MPIWIARDYIRCTGCRKCEIVCSLKHEGRIWPEASRVRIFMYIPGLEVPHLCTQCADHPCVDSCPFQALSIDETTGAILTSKEKCTGCGKCIEACPGAIPFIHPKDGYIVICDLCGGDPECVKVCQEVGYNALTLVKLEKPRPDFDVLKKGYARKPMDVTKDLSILLYGEEVL